tara:strand:- start:19599 stop:20117 length:519 start_codon:yes stop_codon:yes gene_type:complete
MNNIIDYEGLYKINKQGYVYSLYSNKFLKNVKQKNGYLTVTLFREGKGKMFLVHRLVGITFIEKVNGRNQINHIDRDKENNKVCNLEWVTPKENVRHYFKNGGEAWNKGIKCKNISESKKGSKNPMAKKVLNIKNNDVYETLTEASIKLNTPLNTLYSRIKRNSKNNYLKFT